MARSQLQVNALDRIILSMFPRYGLSRLNARARVQLSERHFEAASPGMRTSMWNRSAGDANAAAGPALATLRAHARDLVRNNGWARNGKRVFTRNTVGYGITPKVIAPAVFLDAWKRWSSSTQCDAAGRLTLAGLLKLSAGTIWESGEVLIRRRWRRPEDGLALPVQLQVLEPDHLDTDKHNIKLPNGGKIVYGIEFDAIGRRQAYWLFPDHPGAGDSVRLESRRVPASEIIHSYDLERAGQDRGIPWPAAAIMTIKRLNEFEDAALTKQVIAACLAAFVMNEDGEGPAFGTAVPNESGQDSGFLRIEPGTVTHLAGGKDVKVVNPPTSMDDGFTVRTLRGVAAALGETYEDLVGDYSQVNYSSARMSRVAHWLNVWDWQFNMLIPQICDPVLGWASEAGLLLGLVRPGAPAVAEEWNPMPMPLTDPDKEARAASIRVRNGQASYQQIAREQGSDFAQIVRELGQGNALLDAAGVHLDSDPRRVSQAGVTQARPAGTWFTDGAEQVPEAQAPAAPDASQGDAQDA